jgi:bacillithiol biosynthesis cysteine-adding enzyme BshC
LADATRFLVNAIFGEKGIVVLDGNDQMLKQQFSNVVKKELTQQFVFEEITKTFANKKTKLQVNPRNINLFFLDENLRERIVFEDNIFKINNTDLSFTQDEILDILEKNPEKFSPNALLRPVYQECILPNLGYIGGAAEIAYWLQLKSSFNAIHLTFPMLLMRNSALILTEKQLSKLEKLKLSPQDLLENSNYLIEKISKDFAKSKFDFEIQKQFLKDQFHQLYEIAKNTDVSFEKAVAAQEKKQLNGLDKLEKKLKKAEKRKHENLFLQISELQKELFQDNTWQERHQNFSNFYIKYGDEFFKKLYQEFKPLESEFSFIDL